ncbi:MAG: hypothetical protein KDD83_13470, partial [Caldilineaceae bacterium]|nr:hypothetical protein [Caldilineaceae bacterium]
PWCWAPSGAADVVCGAGLPAKNHISTFAVWQAVKRSDLEATGAGVEPEQPETPTLPPVGNVVRRVSPWAEQMNLQVRTLSEGPMAPEGDLVLIVKDVFTTRDGSWEPDDQPYSVPTWARAAYLEPLGSEDAFTDADADHNLFTAVIGPDGQFVKAQDVVHWSGEFTQLDDPGFTDFVMRQTDAASGWANIPLGPTSSFAPEQGERGPWCWMPFGSRDVVCGGGLPDNLNVSTFVVWQAVERAQLEQGSATSGHSIFLPLITGRPGSTTQGTTPDDAAVDAAIDEGPVPAAAAMDAAAMGADAIDADAIDAAVDEGPLPAGLGAAQGAVQDAAQDADTISGAAWLRQAAWLRIGIEPDLTSPLAEHARANRLGMPVTQVFSVGTVEVQGFMGGIVYMQRGRKETVAVIPW